MKTKHNAIFEAVESFFDHALNLGIVKTKDDERSHNAQFQREDIKDSFRLKTTDLNHYDGISAAFTKVHNYKYIDNPTFKIDFELEMKSQGIAQEEIDKALDIVDEVIKEFAGQKLDPEDREYGKINPTQGDEWSEKDAGWVHLDKIVKNPE